ncbi:major facilitator superfamily domain-containing protein [Radiomyces spectabilis]|uniref:major facilitator superfamily domain-containing protein n=1 Tax=Radiomyces spectabilis TaxID=64574 RepID=UPI00221EAEC7|nr:major facilitator superfamily domain-containing protein [Radiomyces spectabilis]KAI8393430.1 major facilitator superfamily domain-containing protein [Radiomyces spectabilis]
MANDFQYQPIPMVEEEGDHLARREAEKKLVRKYDFFLLPFLSLMYLFSSLDRSSLGNAVLDNFEADVGLTHDQFNWCVTIFYVGFLIFQIPSNMLLKRFTARRWLPLLMLAWGTVACLHASVKNYAQLMAFRFLLGFFEAGFFPGVIFFLTSFYKKNEMATRIAIFWGSTVAAHAYAGVLAYGILQFRGAGGLTGWQWLFLIEGIPTVLLAFVAMLYLPESPSTWSFLTEEEKSLAVTRLVDGPWHTTLGDLSASNKQQILEAMTDWKVWMWMLMFFCGSVPNTSISNFLPSIVKGMGYDDKLSANLMSAPPYLCAVVVMIGLAYSSDRRNDRAYHAILGALICLLGYILLVVLTGRSALYAGVCIAVAGIFVINPIVNAWLTSNIAPDMKKSVATAMGVSANNSAGLLGSNIYRASDAPRYIRGHTINLIFISLFILLALIHRQLLKRTNRIKANLAQAKDVAEDASVRDEDTSETVHEQPDMPSGDHDVRFRYHL